MGSLSRVVVVASVGLLLPRWSAAQNRVPAWTYTMNITYDSGGANRSSIAMRHQVTDRVLRQEFVQVSGNQMGQVEGMYTLLSDADSTMTTVMPAQHAAMIMPMGEMLGGAMKAVPKMSIHNTPPVVVDLGDGGKILGHATRHYRVTTSGTMEMTSGDHTCRQSLGGESEMWIASDIGLGDAMLAEAQHYLRYVDASAIPDATSTAKGYPRGMPLKTVSRSTRDGHTVTITMEVVELSKGDLDASLFQVPADYHTTNMANIMKMVPAQTMDSIMTAQQEKQGSDCV